MAHKANEIRQKIRERIISKRDRHVVAALIINDAKQHPGDWRLAATVQLAVIYKINARDAKALVTEMS